MNPDVITVRFLGIMLLYTLLGLFILAAGGAPFLALAGERLAVARRRVFLDKLGGQLAAMAGILGLCTLPFSLGVWLMGWAGNWLTLYLKDPDLPLPEFSLALAGPVSLLAAGMYALALVLVIVYWLSWKSMRKSKGAHSLLGVLAVAACGAAVLVLVAVKHGSMQQPGAVLADQPLTWLVESVTTASVLLDLIPLAVAVLSLCVASGAGVGLLYLLLRRNKEDFGRDYYSFAFKTCAAWAVAAGSLALFACGWMAFNLFPQLGSLQLQHLGLQLQQQNVFFYLIGLLCLVLACVSWCVVQASPTPLRQKPSAVLGACFLWLALQFQALGIYLTLLV